MFGLGASRELVEQVIRHIDARVANALSRALEGRDLDFADALALAECGGAELDALVLTADLLRREVVGDPVTYVFNRNINFTNICGIGCKFCAFSTASRSPTAYSNTLEEVREKAAEAWAKGAREVCIQGGIDPNDDPWIYRDIIRVIKADFPRMHIHAFSPLEVLVGSERTGLSIRDYLRMLRDEGLGTIPGTAAEILDDDVRARISPLKLRTAQWIEVVKTAHSLGIRSSSTMMYGHLEEPHHWARHVLLLREIQRETGGFTEFVPLGFIHTKTALFRSGKSRPGPTLVEDMKVHAFARVVLHGYIRNVQTSWVKMGHKLALLCLNAGANDYGGTLMEERISKSAGATHGEVTWPHEIRYLIRSIGRVPALRNTTYTEITPEPDLRAELEDEPDDPVEAAPLSPAAVPLTLHRA